MFHRGANVRIIFKSCVSLSLPKFTIDHGGVKLYKSLDRAEGCEGGTLHHVRLPSRSGNL